MGWWSSDILGGDAPLDVVTNFGHEFGFGDEATWSADKPATKFRLEQLSDSEINTFISNCYDPSIAVQAVAYLFMKVGAVLPCSLSESAQKSALSEDVNGWHEPSQRAWALLRFATELSCYNRTTGGLGKVD